MTHDNNTDSNTWTGVVPILHLPAAPDGVRSRTTKSLLRALIRCRSLRVIIALYKQFEFNPDQVEGDRQKTLNGPMSTGTSMSTAAKTTNSTRLKLKEAQEEIGKLCRALPQQNLASHQHSSQESHQLSSIASNKGKPEDASLKTVTGQELEKETAAKNLGAALIDHITDAQAIGAALGTKHRETIGQDQDAMEEDEHSPIAIGSSTSEEEWQDPNDSDAMDEDKTSEEQPLVISSSTSGSSAEPLDAQEGINPHEDRNDPEEDEEAKEKASPPHRHLPLHHHPRPRPLLRHHPQANQERASELKNPSKVKQQRKVKALKT
jgi:hypothetical protein